MGTMGEDESDSVLRRPFHYAQSGVKSVEFKCGEQVMLYLLRKDSIGGTLDSIIETFCDIHEGAEG